MLDIHSQIFYFQAPLVRRMPDLNLRLGDEQYNSSSANHEQAACSPLSAGFARTMTKKRQVGELVNSPLESSWPETTVGTANLEVDATAWSCALTSRLAVNHQDIGHFCKLDTGGILLDLLKELPESHLTPAERQSSWLALSCPGPRSYGDQPPTRIRKKDAGGTTGVPLHRGRARKDKADKLTLP